MGTFKQPYERGYDRGKAGFELPLDAPGRDREDFMQGYEDGKADLEMEEHEFNQRKYDHFDPEDELEFHVLDTLDHEDEFDYSFDDDLYDHEDDLYVLGKCEHGTNLDTDFCPQGCRV